MHLMLCMVIQSILVFVAFTQHCIQCTVYSVYRASCPSIREGYLKSLLSCGFSSSPVQGGSFINFLGLVNYKGDCRQDTQPIPNS